VEVAGNSVPPALRLCRLCGGEHTGRVVKGPKSRAGNRWVPLPRAAQVALRRHRHAQDLERRHRPYRDHDLVFCTPTGDPLRPGRVSAQFADHVDASGLPAIRLHDLRHSACSLLLAGGVPIEVVQMILGHAHPATTRRIYVHLIRETKPPNRSSRPPTCCPAIALPGLASVADQERLAAVSKR
jgi:integrase